MFLAVVQHGDISISIFIWNEIMSRKLSYDSTIKIEVKRKARLKS
jgi:hypothetical protein